MSEDRRWNRGVLALSFSFAVLSMLAIVAAYLWTTRSDAVEPIGGHEAFHEPATLTPTSSERGATRGSSATFGPRPVLRLIMTAVADDPSESTATVHVDAREETFVAHPGDVVASDSDSDEAAKTDGGVAVTDADTILESVGPGWARFERTGEQWTLEIADEAQFRKPGLDDVVAIFGDGSLSPGEIAHRLLAAKRGLPIPENFLSEASFAPRFDEQEKMTGLVVRSVVPDGVFARMGLAGGDVLLAVDGVTLDSPEASDKALESFQHSAALRITRERGGVVESVLVQRAPATTSK